MVKDLDDLELEQRRFDHQLGGELHPRRLQAEDGDDVLAETAQPAMKVTDLALEEQPADEREHGVAEILVQERHRPRLDAALEAVAHHEIVAGAELLDVQVEVFEKS